MTPINSSQLTPAPLEMDQTAKSAMQTNKPVEDAVLESIQEDLKKGDTEFQDNLAVAAAQLTGKGISLNVNA